ncbi:MAG: TetR/AcrR family transcriptional regulator [bacterium]|nr:TetR/AcrR family transcriptional regulator [bacterium]
MSELFKRDVRRLILELARKKFLHFGVRKTTIEEIARELKISKKTLYEHFQSKMDIWENLLELESKITKENLKTYLPGEQPPLTRMEKLCGYYFRRNLQNQSGTTDDPNEGMAAQKQLREISMSNAFVFLLTELIEEARSSEAIRNIPSEVLAHLVRLVLDRMVKDCIQGKSITLEEAKRLSLAMVRNSG